MLVLWRDLSEWRESESRTDTRWGWKYKDNMPGVARKSTVEQRKTVWLNYSFKIGLLLDEHVFHSRLFKGNLTTGCCPPLIGNCARQAILIKPPSTVLTDDRKQTKKRICKCLLSHCAFISFKLNAILNYSSHGYFFYYYSISIIVLLDWI